MLVQQEEVITIGIRMEPKPNLASNHAIPKNVKNTFCSTTPTASYVIANVSPESLLIS